MNDTTAAPAAVADDFEVEQSGASVIQARTQVPPVEATEHTDTVDVDAAEPFEASGEPAAPKKERNSVQARIDKAIAAQRAAERERDEYRARVEAAERARTEPKREEPAVERREPQYTRPKPTEDEIGSKYESYPAFVEDLADWKLEQRDHQQAIAARQRAIAERHEANASQFVEQIAKAEQSDPDFWSKISPRIANLRPSSTLEPGERMTADHAIADMIFDSEYSSELMAHLSAHDKEFQRLSTLPPNLLFREMGRLEAFFSRPAAASPGPARVTPPVSQAAPPIKPVGSTASASERDPLADDLDVDEHIRVMNARERKASRR